MIEVFQRQIMKCGKPTLFPSINKVVADLVCITGLASALMVSHLVVSKIVLF